MESCLRKIMLSNSVLVHVLNAVLELMQPFVIGFSCINVMSFCYTTLYDSEQCITRGLMRYMAWYPTYTCLFYRCHLTQTLLFFFLRIVLLSFMFHLCCVVSFLNLYFWNIHLSRLKNITPELWRELVFVPTAFRSDRWTSGCPAVTAKCIRSKWRSWRHSEYTHTYPTRPLPLKWVSLMLKQWDKHIWNLQAASRTTHVGLYCMRLFSFY